MTYFQPSFTAQSAAVRVRFAPGIRVEAGAEVERLGARRALVLATPQQSDLAMEVAGLLGGRAAGVHARAAMHTPVEVTEAAISHVAETGADCLVAVGGGSTVGLAKAIALRTDLPQVAIPTTYAGSEATPILGQTEGGRKTTLTDERVRPEVILYDAELVASLPAGMTATSAMNAMAHAAEALYAEDRNPLASALAVEALRAFTSALPRVLEAPGDLAARGETLYGAWLCGTVLGQVGMSLHHKLCHALGGAFGLPHAETHAVILPHTIAFNEAAVPELLAPLAEALGAERAGAGLRDLVSRIGAPTSLREIGLAEGCLDWAADLATEKPYWNPRPVERGAIRDLLEAAWEGRAPAVGT